MNMAAGPPSESSALHELRIDNEISEIGRVAELVDRVGADHKLPDEVTVALNVSLDEILNNIISYAYADSGRHEIVVRLEIRSGCVEVVVEDDGKPFDPLAVPPPDLAAGMREEGGVGIHFVRSLTDELTYTRREGINQLRFMKRL
jgi:anti-sigma regulatory factor (Ser/Thr protein kinase)